MRDVVKDVGRAIEAERESLAAAITARHYELQPELESRYGPAGREKCLQDARYHLSYLAEAVAASSPALFADYVGWAKVMLAARGVPAADLARNIECMREALRRNLRPEAGGVVSEYLDAGLKRLPQSPAELPALLDEAGPHAELARHYLTLLLRGERHLASRLVLDAADAGVGVREIYLHVFQRTQREIGRLWQMNKINVAQEHYCTASTQLIMSQLYPRIFRTERRGRALVATGVAGELHEIGVRVVADFFEMEGWDTYYLGANAPTPSILQAVADRKAHVLAVSATMTFHLRAVEELIAAARADGACRGVKIMVGGYPFALEPELWRRVGADFYAADAEQAVEAANRLCGGSSL
ncbi:MAG TPA: cobalamin-dependent protein [Pyrinomonadaceae bacterium]